MWRALAAFLLGLFKGVLAPRSASATTEAEKAGAAERDNVIHIEAQRSVHGAVGARLDADRAARAVPVTDELPDDGFRRD